MKLKAIPLWRNIALYLAASIACFVVTVIAAAAMNVPGWVWFCGWLVVLFGIYREVLGRYPPVRYEWEDE